MITSESRDRFNDDLSKFFGLVISFFYARTEKCEVYLILVQWITVKCSLTHMNARMTSNCTPWRPLTIARMHSMACSLGRAEHSEPCVIGLCNHQNKLKFHQNTFKSPSKFNSETSFLSQLFEGNSSDIVHGVEV